jgi:hypothetical protein
VLCDSRNYPIVESFVKKMMGAARKRGLIFAMQPTITTFNPNNARGWPELFERCVNRNVEFIM